MQRNSDMCEPCGKAFVRLTGDTPIIGPPNGFVSVAILLPAKSQKKTAKQVEEVADKIAELVQNGKKLVFSYIQKGQLRIGFFGQ